MGSAVLDRKDACSFRRANFNAAAVESVKQEAAKSRRLYKSIPYGAERRRDGWSGTRDRCFGSERLAGYNVAFGRAILTPQTVAIYVPAHRYFTIGPPERGDKHLGPRLGFSFYRSRRRTRASAVICTHTHGRAYKKNNNNNTAARQVRGDCYRRYRVNGAAA